MPVMIIASAPPTPSRPMMVFALRHVVRHAAMLGLALAPAFPVARTIAHAQPSPRGASSRAWVDTNPHRSAFIAHRGVRLHYLDWGGTGPVVVLMPGYALTAHAFDDIGHRLSREFRVVAITPRGFGESDAPDTSDYTIATLAADLRAVLDSLGVRRAALVGHSLSGSTISAFAIASPERVTRLVYLDAFPYFAAAGGDSVDARSPVPSPAFSGDMTYPRVRRFLERYRFGGWSPALDADLHANVLGAELARRRALTEGYIADQRLHPPDLSRITVPALQLCAIPTVATEYPWRRAGTVTYSRAVRYVRDVLQPFDRALCARFAHDVPSGRTLEVRGSHYVFFTEPALAAAAIARFLRE